MLADLAFEFDEAESFDFKSAGRIRRMLGEYDIFLKIYLQLLINMTECELKFLLPMIPRGLIICALQMK